MTKRYLIIVCLCLAWWGVNCSSSQTEQGPVVADEPDPSSVPEPNPIVKDGAWSKSLEGIEHPRLFGPREFLKSQAIAKSDLYKKIKEGINVEALIKSESGELLHDALIMEGVLYAVDETKIHASEMISEALKLITKPVSNSHMYTWLDLMYVALAYDAFYDLIGAADRVKMVSWMNQHLEVYKEDEWFFTASVEYKILCYLWIAYATWGENEQAKNFRDYAILNLYETRLVPALNKLGDGGGGNGEGGWYNRVGLWQLVQALELARRLQGYDGFQKAPKFFYQRLAYELHQSYPNMYQQGAFFFRWYAMEGDGAMVPSQYVLTTRLLLMSYFRGSELAKYTANIFEPSERLSDEGILIWLTQFLYVDELDTRISVNSVPTSHYASGIGRIYARSNWKEDASWLRFECGDYYDNHNHYEVGNFEIYRNEPLATESGYYDSFLSLHSVNWYIRTIAHNSILVYMPGEKIGYMRDGPHNSYDYANDGGQLAKWNYFAQTLDDWEKYRTEKNFESAEVVAYENQPQFMYTACDGTKAYSADKLEKWIRQIVFLRPHTFVIFDRVISREPSYEKTWLLHSFTQPLVGTDAFSIKNGNSKLFGLSLLPKNKRIIEKIYGFTYGGRTFDPKTDAVNWQDKAGMWRIEISPADEQKETLFLHVLSTDEEPDAELIEDADMIGVRVDSKEVWFSGDVGGGITISNEQYSLASGIKKGKFE